MAQTTRSSSRSSSSGSRSKRSTSGNGSSKTTRSSSKRTSSNGSRSGTARSRSKSRSTTRSASTSAARRGSSSSNGAVAKTGGKVAELASKAKTPLLAGGAALAGVAGGVALKSRNQSRRPIDKLKAVSLPKSLKNVDLGKLDVKSLTDAARTVRSIGEQVGDVADAADKTRKKHK
jgi:hypothetical protein